MPKPTPARLLGYQHLQAIHAIVMAGSVTGAAERLFVTQPALSNRLKDAEERIGFELFERRAGRLVATEPALLLFEEIERSLVSLEQINEFCARLSQQRRRRMSIACTPVLGAAVLPQALAAIGPTEQDLHFTIESRSANQVAALVASRKADVGFALDTPPMPGVESELIAQLSMVCYLPPRHRLAQPDAVISAAQLCNEPMIGLSRIEGIEQIVQNAFQPVGGLPPQAAQCPAAMIACAMVGAGLGFTIFDALPARLLAPDLVSVHRFEPEITLRYRAYWPSSREPNLAVRQLIDLMRASFASIEASEAKRPIVD